MKKNLSEKQVLDCLNISDFSQITTDKISEFAALAPYMNPELVKAAMEKFPEYREMAQQLVSEYKETLDKLTMSNEESMKQLYATCNSIISSLQEELKSDNITSSDRERIENKMIEIAHLLSEKDTDNKNFLANIAMAAGYTIAAVLGAGALIVGALFFHKSDDD